MRCGCCPRFPCRNIFKLRISQCHAIDLSQNDSLFNTIYISNSDVPRDGFAKLVLVTVLLLISLGNNETRSDILIGDSQRAVVHRKDIISQVANRTLQSVSERIVRTTDIQLFARIGVVERIARNKTVCAAHSHFMFRKLCTIVLLRISAGSQRNFTRLNLYIAVGNAKRHVEVRAAVRELPCGKAHVGLTIGIFPHNYMGSRSSNHTVYERSTFCRCEFDCRYRITTALGNAHRISNGVFRRADVFLGLGVTRNSDNHILGGYR